MVDNSRMTFTGELNNNENLDIFKTLLLKDDIPSLSDFKLDCNYYSEKDFVSKYKNSQTNLAISLNIQSLASKFDSFLTTLDLFDKNNINISIIALQEIWAIPDANTFSIKGFKFVYKARKSGRGGGVAFYIREGLSFKIIEKLSIFEENVFENLVVEITLPKQKSTIFSCIYRPNNHKTLTPNEQINEFLNIFAKHAESLSSLKLPTYILSDTNLDLLKINNENSKDFLEICTCYGFLPLISKATRFQNASYSAIDHIFALNEQNIYNAGVITDQLSDHMLTFCEIGNLIKKKASSNTRFIEKRIINDQTIQAFKVALFNQSWADVENAITPDIAFCEFFDVFNTLYELFFPLISIKVNKKFSPRNAFMTPALLVSRDRKLQLAKLSKKYPTVQNIDFYKSYRNLYNTLVRKSKNIHYGKKIQNCKGKSRKLWDVLKEITNSKGKKQETSEIEINDVRVSDKNTIVNGFKDYFSSIGKETANNVKPTTTNFSEFLPPRCDQSIFFQPTHPGEIIDILDNFEGKNSTDINGFSTAFLKKIAWNIASPLSIIANKSYEQGIFPDLMKISKTVPILKKDGIAHEMSSSRPISIVNAFSTVLEKLAEKRLMSFLLNTDFFFNAQFGFLKGRSTSHAILDLIDFVSKALNNNEYCLGIFLDVKKAYDSVSHEILLAKLENAGVRGIPLLWIKSFISNRRFKVFIDGYWSECSNPLDISVLQGSILGAILFLVYMNDFPRATQAKSLIYADDSNCLFKSNNLDNLKAFAETELKKISLWFRANKLQISAPKTQFMLFTSRNGKIIKDFSLSFDLNDPGEDDISNIIPLRRVSEYSGPRPEDKSVRMLGFYLDERLNFKHHIDIVSKKLSKATFILNRVKHTLPMKCRLLLYFSLFHCHLNYCSIILSAASPSVLNKLVKLQKRAVRTIKCAPFLAHTAEIFKDLNILPVKALIEYNVIIFMNKYRRNTLPPLFKDYFPLNHEVRHINYILRNVNNLHIVRVKYEYLKKFPFILFPEAWNNFSCGYKDEDNPFKFASQLKADLIYKHTIQNCSLIGCVDCLLHITF